jgi:hypothetical protein
MSVDHSHHAAESGRTHRLWLIEALIVVGLLGLGYFAVSLDDTLWAGVAPPTTTVPPTDLSDR